MSGSDWVFSAKSLRPSLISHISTKTTGKLKPFKELLNLPWPKFLEEEKAEEVGYTPLHIACMFGSSKAINGLLKAGANPKVSALFFSLRRQTSTELSPNRYIPHPDGML
eukprot:jgi/Bigna1/58794/fgenesh1_kg.1_\